MTSATTPGTAAVNAAAAWPPPHRPIAVLAHPGDMPGLVDGLRAAASQHHDTAWVHPNPSVQLGGQRGVRGTGSRRTKLPTLGQELLDAIGCVGLSTPRTAGEAHLIRPLTHLIHGPVRHVIVHDAILLDVGDLIELHQAGYIGSVQLWLLIDIADSPALRSQTKASERLATEVLEWVNLACTTQTPQAALARWAARREESPGCVPPPASWWRQPLAAQLPLPAACPHHACRVDCLLGWVRRALTSGQVSPAIARALLADYIAHPDARVADRWALTAAGRDLYTPASDALAQIGLNAARIRLRDVAYDGNWARDPDRSVAVPDQYRIPLARMRTSRRLAGCLPHEPFLGLFDTEPGIRRRR